MKKLIEAINRLAAAQEESNRISKLNTELLQSVLTTAQKSKQITEEMLRRQDNSNPILQAIFDRRPIQQQMRGWAGEPIPTSKND